MIESFTKNDSDEIMDIWLTTNITAHSFISQQIWQELYPSVKLALNDADIFLFREDGVIKGFIGIANRSYIAGLFVLPLYHSQGIGRLLLTHSKQLYSSLQLNVFVKNTDAIRFYQKNSFSVCDTKNNPQFGQEEHTMQWNRHYSAYPQFSKP